MTAPCDKKTSLDGKKFFPSVPAAGGKRSENKSFSSHRVVSSDNLKTEFLKKEHPPQHSQEEPVEIHRKRTLTQGTSFLPRKETGKIDCDSLEDLSAEENSVSNLFDQIDEEAEEDRVQAERIKTRIWAALDEEFSAAGYSLNEENEEEDLTKDENNNNSNQSPKSALSNSYELKLSGAVENYVKERELKQNRIMHQGYLMKFGGKMRTKDWNRRWFVLDDKELAYYKKPGDQTSAGTINLDKISKVFGVDDKIRRNCFEIVTKDRNFVACADTKREMEQWMTILFVATNKINNNKPWPSGDLNIIIKFGDISKEIKINAASTYEVAKANILSQINSNVVIANVELYSIRLAWWLSDICNRFKISIGCLEELELRVVE